MSKYIVSVFDDEGSVYKGASALQALHDKASVTLYEGAVVAKAADGTVSIMDWREEGPINTLAGMMLGSLVGMLAGPAGMAVGAASGSIGGLLVDAARTGVSDVFLDDVLDELAPGKFALVAEIDEMWTIPLDTAMQGAGGVLFRAWRYDIEDAQIDRDIEANKREMAELQAEWEQADAEARAKLQAKIDAAKAKLTAMGDRIKNKLELMKTEYDEKIEKIEQQISQASDELRSNQEKTRDDIKADYEQRSAKLKQSGQLAAEAFS